MNECHQGTHSPPYNSQNHPKCEEEGIVAAQHRAIVSELQGSGVAWDDSGTLVLMEIAVKIQLIWVKRDESV